MKSTITRFGIRALSFGAVAMASMSTVLAAEAEGKKTFYLVIGCAVALGKVSHRRTKLTVGATVLTYYNFSVLGVWVFNVYGVL